MMSTPMRAQGQNLSELAHNAIKTDIMNASLVPGEKLQIETISERYGIGVNPVREALNRLSAEGWVERRSQRGFFVKAMSIRDLEELVQTRIWLETLALRESMARGDERWEEEVILAHHRLVRAQRAVARKDKLVQDPTWQLRHNDFHMTLLSRCGSSWLLEFCAKMMDQSVRYRNLSVSYNWARRGDAAEEHQAILDAVLDRDIDQAAAFLEAHYKATLDGLRAIVSELPSEPDPPTADPNRA